MFKKEQKEKRERDRAQWYGTFHGERLYENSLWLNVKLCSGNQVIPWHCSLLQESGTH